MNDLKNLTITCMILKLLYPKYNVIPINVRLKFTINENWYNIIIFDIIIFFITGHVIIFLRKTYSININSKWEAIHVRKNIYINPNWY